MFKNIDYTKTLSLVKYINSLDPKIIKRLNACLKASPQKEAIDHNNNQIHSPTLAHVIHQEKLFKPFIPTISDDIPLDIYINLCVNQYNFHKSSNYKTVLEKIRSIPIYKVAYQIHNDLAFISLVHALYRRKSSWVKFIEGFNGNDWQEIHLLAETLPISNAKLDEFIVWISLVVEKQSKDLALNGIAKYIYEWIIRSKTVYLEIDRDLVELAANNSVNLILGSLLRGIKEKQQKNNKYYIRKLENIIVESNAYKILHALGIISLDDKTSIDIYYQLLLYKVNHENLRLSDFISLCSIFQLHRQELFSKIDNIIKISENESELRSIIRLLINDEKNEIEPSWKLKSSYFLFAKNIDSIQNELDYFLISIADRDLQQAYELFEARMKIMAHINLLKAAFIHIVQKDLHLFQSKLINWLNQEDSYLHLAVREICSIHELNQSLFEIPINLFENYSNEDKLYIAYKIVGYVYSMVALQRLILSLVESIDKENDSLNTAMYFILTEYVAYNYRGTLELIKKSLIEHKLTAFAKELFEKTIEYFENYFTQLKSILMDKELKPYKEHLLLKRFYMQKQFSGLPETARKNSISNLFKNTQINSSKWAIRRSGQLKHEIRDLGHISVTSEFPSGEILNPIYQEYIRRTYQKIQKNEINFH
ncbi:hypothetical protein EFY79_02530 [Hanamia caeni]|uniref:Uncharacterized protein n=1 Tax=Hanamia caeni TaxID=2294116 RepID=A0A3M9NQU4_9BACT|nr:hypothetical protein [Hanamia caeni]RNI40191.1 hypothetical protein EFY79_02530 [Hanamia caeni]